ncbi:MAG: DUF1611 domain-containing protein [Crenarchaeota archaeon]|nr:DUF1611 domain-containing protein [Thermoproteota archaeon]
MERELLKKLKARAVVLAEGKFGDLTGKTCNILVMYSGWRRVTVLSVIDSRYAGMDAGEVLKIGKLGIPVVSTLREALKICDPDTLIVGISPVGGRLPEHYRKIIIEAIDHGLNIWSGLHIFLSDDPEISKLAESRGVSIIDFRKPPRDLRIWSGQIYNTKTVRILVAGTDCSVGKNVTSIELVRELERRGLKVGLVGTGQTMLMVGADAGTVVDAVPADFVPGEVERHIVELDKENMDVIIIEGQASLLHPAYSQVTLGIYYGSMPHGVVLCHDPWRTYRESFEHLKIRVPSIEEEINAAKAHISNIKFIAISIMGRGRTRNEIEETCRMIEEKYQIPAADPRLDIGKIADKVEELIRSLT